MNRVLVTGGSGFIGLHLVEKLLQSGLYVYLLTRNARRVKVANERLMVVEGSFGDAACLERLNGAGIEDVYHLAVCSDGSQTNPDEEYKVNVEHTDALVKWANEQGVRRFFYASSIEAIGPSESSSAFLSETAEPRPVSHYGFTKMRAEELVSGDFKGKYVIGRIGNTYGEGSYGFVPAFMKALREKNALWKSLHALNSIRVQPVYVDDLVEMIVTAMEHEGSLVVNLMSNEVVSVAQWARVTAECIGELDSWFEGFSIGTKLAQATALRKEESLLDYFLGEPPRCHRIYSIDLLYNTLGFRHKYNVYRGTAKTAAWALEKERKYETVVRGKV